MTHLIKKTEEKPSKEKILIPSKCGQNTKLFGSITSHEIAEVINNPDNPNVSKEVHEKIKKLHLRNLHKFNIATYRKDK